MELNSKQREAVEHLDGPLLIIAGAGSGKTRVIVHRIFNLITRHRVHPSNILAVTFTNKAANEMRGRLEKMLGVSLKNLWISTFHSACLKILRHNSELAGLNPHFQVIDEGTQISIIKESLTELNINEKAVSPQFALSQISRAKDRCASPEDFALTADNFYMEKVSQVYSLYQQKLATMQAADFGDLIRLTVLLFEKNPEVLKRYMRYFKYILVDEYQDTNHAQYRLIENLTKEHKNICVVGDEDQSIYRWRGADISNILRFEKDFPGAKAIKLEQNYRSTKKILSAAHAVISNNTERKPKKLWTDGEEGSHIKIITTPTERAEAEAIAGEIIKIQMDKDTLKDIAIFYRTNAQSRPFEEVFLKERIPYRIYGGMRFYERMEIKDIIAYLRIIAFPQDDISFLRIINVPTRGLGKKTIDLLKNYAGENSASLFEAIPSFCHSGRIKAGTLKKLSDFYNTINELRQKTESLSLSSLIQEVLQKSGYIESLNNKRDYMTEERLENINELLSAAEEFEPITDDPPLTQFLDQIALVSDIDSLDETKSAVTMMTLHLAKGLEFENVFIVGMEEGLLPHSRSIDEPEELEEERRLCYVGMTRAKRNLVMSHAFKRQLFGNAQYNVISRFIDEIPEELTKKATFGLGEYSSPAPVKQPYYAVKSFVKQNERQDYDFDQRPPEERIGKFSVGQRVMHPAFGHGLIRRSEPSSLGHKVTVHFNNGIIKRLIAEKAGLETL